jgi:HD-like signal output (HDOD) protein
MGKKKPYLPNNWDEYKNADDNDFIPHTFEEIMSWKVAGWELPASVVCIIRKTDIETKKTVEYTYSRYSAAQRKLDELIGTPGIEITICDHEQIHFLTPAE